MKLNSISVSMDDGHPLDLKAAKILAKKNIQTTFYIPIKNSTGRPTLNKKQIKWLSQNPSFSIGGHTYNHVDLTKVPLAKAEEEIRTGKEALEDIIGKKITSFAWPWGRYNQDLIDLLKKLGFSECRGISLINFNIPDKKNFLWFPNYYLIRCEFIQELRHILKRIDLYSLYIRLKYLKSSHLELVDIYKQLHGKYHFWFHSWELEELNLWDNLVSL